MDLHQRNESTGRSGSSEGKAPLPPNAPTGTGSRSERVLSLLLTLAALRAAPELLSQAKV